MTLVLMIRLYATRTRRLAGRSIRPRDQGEAESKYTALSDLSSAFIGGWT